MNGYASISPVRLKIICETCLSNREKYNGEGNTTHTYKNPFIARLLFGYPKGYQVTRTPNWAYEDDGIDKKLKSLIVVCDNVILDSICTNKDIQLSLTTYEQLMKLMFMCDDFEPFMFVNRC